LSESQVLRELASSLTEKERHELLEKIKQSLHITDDSEEDIVEKQLDEKERDKLIRQEISQTSLLTRLILWFKSIFSGRSKKEIYLNMKIQTLKKRIQRKSAGITGFETRDLTPKMAELVLQLYTTIHPLVKLFRLLWKNPDVFDRVFTSILEKTLDSPKKALEDLVTIERLEEVYSREGLKDAIRKEVVKEIEDYVETIPDELIGALEKEFTPLFYLRDTVLFPYNDLFELFHYKPDVNSQVAPFKSASAMIALKLLERLYYALYTIGKIEEPMHFSNELCVQLGNLEGYVSRNETGEKEEDLEELSENGPVEKPSGSEEDSESKEDSLDHYAEMGEQVLRNAREALKSAKKFNANVPLAELIRYFKRDPYYKMMIYVPELKLRDFYSSALKMRLLPQIDGIFKEIRQRVVTKRIDELFEGRQVKNFRYYRKYSSLEYEKLGLPVFTNIGPLTFLFNFLDLFYRLFIQECIQILSRGILQQNRLTLNRLLVYAGEAEETHDRIQQFDNSLSPDEDDGKLFQRLRFKLASNTSHQRLYRNLIIQKDKEVQTHLAKGKESLAGIKKVFDEILTSPTESVKGKLSTYYFVQGESATLKNLLMKCSTGIDSFHKLMYQVEKLDSGS